MGSGGGKRWLLPALVAILFNGCDLNPRPEDPTNEGDHGADNNPGTPRGTAGGSAGTVAGPTGSGGSSTGPIFTGAGASQPDAGIRDAGADAADSGDAADAADANDGATR